MQAVDSVALSRFQHEDIHAFMSEIIALTKRYEIFKEIPQTHELATLHKLFVETLGMDVEKASEALFLADIDADNMLLTAKSQLEICAKSQHRERRQAALDLLKVFNNYTDFIDKPYDKPYIEEYKYYKQLLDQLDELSSETKTMLYLDEWIERMHIHFNIMKTLMERYSSGLKAFDPNATKHARKKLENAWMSFELIITAMGLVAYDDNIDVVVDEINHIIQKYMSIVLARQSEAEEIDLSCLDIL